MLDGRSPRASGDEILVDWVIAQACWPFAIVRLLKLTLIEEQRPGTGLALGTDPY
jgi:hypothetical protein